MGDPQPGEPLLHPVMRAGRRLDTLPTASEARAHTQAQLERLPPALRRLDRPGLPPVEIAPAVRALADEMDGRST